MKKNNNTNKLAITSKISKLQKLASSIIMFIVSAILLIIGVFAIIRSAFFIIEINFASEVSLARNDNIILNIVLCLSTIILLYFIYKILPKIKLKILLIIALLFSFGIGIWWVNYIKFEPLSDQSLVVYCAECLLDKDVQAILNPGEYLNRNPHQLGFILYIMTVFKLFASRETLNLQILNVIYSTINCFLLFLITKKLFKEEIINKISLLLITAFSIYFMFFSTHVYGNIPGLTFALLAILFTIKFLDTGKFTNIIVIAISITIAYMLKSNYEIILLAILGTLVLGAMQQNKSTLLIAIPIILVCVFGIKSVIYSTIEKNTGYSLDTGVPMLTYIYMGIAEPVSLSPGWYTGDVEIIYNEAGYNSDESLKITEERLDNRLEYLKENPSYTLEYFKNKLQSTWLNPTFQVIWCSTPSTLLDLKPEYNERINNSHLLISMIDGKAYNIEERAFDVYQIITFIFAGIGMLYSFKEGNSSKTILPLAFIGGFLFHLIWETKSIYVLQYFYLMLPFASLGLYKFFNKIDTLIKK